jgi:cell division protein FtsW (lipid II flippase)
MSVFIGLLLVGLVMVYSANLPLPSNNTESVFWRGMRGHPIHLLIGLVTMFLMTRVPTTILHSLSTPLFFLTTCSGWHEDRFWACHH